MKGKYLEKEIRSVGDSVMIDEGGDADSQHERIMMVVVVIMEKKEFKG